MLKHLCGQCSKTFRSLSAYLTHHCLATGYSPKHAPLQVVITDLKKTPPFQGGEDVIAKKKTDKLSENDILAAVTAARKAKQRNA
ncbi:hypothetical protein A2210_01070 [Candidatus Woesebacteria bacterium RIFOXYA1_FULL_40_18]|uniref:C2H2-type domain-containing protein n=2 Tax=Candidatus Woeseibacteriota TaxID=1752722 RepID=A0A1F8CJE4_9BACT|nr:MAG: hypothetical protein A2210_01070 [Candidatus Woesebacteria bacterium RIFOXYA1_FULL_40_18]OGM80594.1 MAG: hypothetical protein A2361_00510 [Candidatus Woesebacteria bacterium RIFOXYB1_FULL_40_26]